VVDDKPIVTIGELARALTMGKPSRQTQPFRNDHQASFYRLLILAYSLSATKLMICLSKLRKPSKNMPHTPQPLS
jgi:hypothetical protein